MNPIHADQLKPNERLAEIAGLLAAGLVRLNARKSRRFYAHTEESSLDLVGTERSGGRRIR